MKISNAHYYDVARAKMHHSKQELGDIFFAHKYSYTHLLDISDHKRCVKDCRQGSYQA
jgi:hypothetical protein